MKIRCVHGAVSLALLAMSQASPAAELPDPKITQVLTDISPARIEQHIRKLVSFGTRHTLSETESDTHGIGAARRWIQKELQDCSAQAGGRLQVTMDEFTEPAGPRVPHPVQLVNVVATLPGVSPLSRDRLLVVSGHYDSRRTDVMDATGDSPGANDDASGVAAVMEMACAMARQKFDATLVFLAVPGEEQGLLGAGHWAREARRKGLNVEGMITNDIIGSSTGDAGQHDDRQVRLFANGMDPLLRQLTRAPSKTPPSEEDARAAEAVTRNLQAQALAGGTADLPTDQFGRHIKAEGERYVPGFTVNLIQRRDRYLRGGDHIPFLENGYAAVRMTEPFENFDHQHQDVRTENGKLIGDLPEYDDFNYIANVARVNAAALGTLALAPAAPSNVRLEASELTNDSTLSWSANAEPDLGGYRVVWRRLDSPVWQQSKDVGLVTTVRLPVSKDNVVFGVQALSRTGHASLASFPLPQRR